MNTFSFDTLSNATPLRITRELEKQVQSIGEESFPDDEGVSFSITRAMQADNRNYIEVTPDQDTGYEKYVFELDADFNISRCYSLEDGEYELLFD